MRRWGLFLAAVLVVLIGAIWLAPRWTPARAEYPMQGIDVSAHQGPVDWAKLKAEGVDFAYIKASEGGDFRDKAFLGNWQASARAGIRHGAYHYFTLCKSGAEQAANLLAAVPNERDALPPAVDLEFLGNCTSADRMTPDQLRLQLKAFLDAVERRTGKPTILYLTKEFDNAYRVSARFNHPLWLRRLFFEPRFGARPWTIWQASNFRHLDGIQRRVDWNVARLTWMAPPPHQQP